MREFCKTRELFDQLWTVDEFLPVGEGLLAVSPILKAPFTLPLRIVLRRVNDGYVVHSQCFEGDPENHGIRWHYHEGDYFTSPNESEWPDLFAAAYGRWLERCQVEQSYIQRRCKFVA